MRKILILLATICCCGCGMPETNIPDITTGLNETHDDPRASVMRNNKRANKSINIIKQLYGGNAPQMYIVEIEGHEYIVVGPPNNPRIIHAEHCPCKNK